MHPTNTLYSHDGPAQTVNRTLALHKLATHMPEEVISPEEGTNPTPEVVTETTVEETVETPAPPQRTYTQAEWDILHGRATKAEADLKRNVQPATPLNVEETVLLANGMSDELLKELKAVAQVRGLSLLKAQADPLFVAVKANFEEAKKKEAASLPASRGAAPVAKKKDFSTPGITRDEHKEMFYSSQS